MRENQGAGVAEHPPSHCRTINLSHRREDPMGTQTPVLTAYIDNIRSRAASGKMSHPTTLEDTRTSRTRCGHHLPSKYHPGLPQWREHTGRRVQNHLPSKRMSSCSEWKEERVREDPHSPDSGPTEGQRNVIRDEGRANRPGQSNPGPLATKHATSPRLLLVLPATRRSIWIPLERRFGLAKFSCTHRRR